MSPPAMQGLRQLDLDLFVSEAGKPHLNSERDHMSVLSDEDSVPAEEGKEAGPRDDNLVAAFARDFVDDYICSGKGAKYEEWAAVMATRAGDDKSHQSKDSTVVQKDDGETSNGSLNDEDQADEVQVYNLAACREEVFSSMDYDVFCAQGDGTAAHIVPESVKATGENREGSVGGCLPTATLRNREDDDEIRGDDQEFRGDRPKASNDEPLTTERVDQEGSEDVATDTRDAVSVATASASGGTTKVAAQQSGRNHRGWVQWEPGQRQTRLYLPQPRQMTRNYMHGVAWSLTRQ